MIETDALVLARTDYRDADRMITLFSPEQGRLDAVVRGCKKPKSPLMGAAECFTAGRFALTENRGRLSVTGCQIKECYYDLRKDYERLTAGAYFLRLLLCVVQPGAPAPALFLDSLKALACLNYAPLPPALVTAAFEMRLMALGGQAPVMDACVRCGGRLTGENLRFDLRQGGAVCDRCPGAGPRLSQGARRILYKAPRAAFESVTLLEDRPEWPEAARHIRAFLCDRLELDARRAPALPRMADIQETEGGSLPWT